MIREDNFSQRGTHTKHPMTVKDLVNKSICTVVWCFLKTAMTSGCMSDVNYVHDLLAGFVEINL